MSGKHLLGLQPGVWSGGQEGLGSSAQLSPVYIISQPNSSTHLNTFNRSFHTWPQVSPSRGHNSRPQTGITRTILELRVMLLRSPKRITPLHDSNSRKCVRTTCDL